MKNANADVFSVSSIKTDTYTLTLTAKHDGRQVYVKITDADGNTVTSDIATIHVGEAPAND